MNWLGIVLGGGPLSVARTIRGGLVSAAVFLTQRRKEAKVRKEEKAEG
jgi:hypothetical protein